MEERGYTKKCILGRGTYGTVFLCKDRFDKKCVIKQISLPTTNYEATKQFIKLVNQEIYLLTNLQHPRIIRLITHFTIDNGNYICIEMEYAKYGTIKDMIARYKSTKKCFQQSIILQFFCDILLGMEYLHIKNVIHRDLKSENILLDANGRIKIADFGIASVNWNYSKTKQPIGTPYYMPPETLQHNEISFASDIWALGCILYEFCMLAHPFGIATTKSELLAMTTKCAYVPLKYAPMQYDKGMENLIKIQLEPDKTKRATISKIICDPIIMGQYYENYFKFD